MFFILFSLIITFKVVARHVSRFAGTLVTISFRRKTQTLMQRKRNNIQIFRQRIAFNHLKESLNVAWSAQSRCSKRKKAKRMLGWWHSWLDLNFKRVLLEVSIRLSASIKIKVEVNSIKINKNLWGTYQHVFALVKIWRLSAFAQKKSSSL